MIDINYHQNTRGRPFRLVGGDLIALAEARHFDVIGHGCNCLHQMGAGIAKTLAQRFPSVMDADRTSPYGVESKLGSYTAARIDHLDLTILNLYTQFSYHGPMPRARYDAIEGCARLIARDFRGQRVGLPLIGAGLAGGDWLIIKEILGVALEPVDLTVVVYTPPSA